MQTTEYRIEREIMIDAPVEVVWNTITEPDQITQWFADTVDLEVAPGAHGYMGFGDHGGGVVVVDTVDPPTRFSFRWNQPAEEEPAPGNSLLVEFTLEGDGEQTRLTVVESGLDLLTWSSTEKQRYADEHNGGWADFLGRLARLLAERPRG
jgi:uncharacterized protein YndB with AHSA1/START domain